MFVLLSALQVNAQEFTYKVRQDRLIGHREGELIISTDHVEFRAKKNDSRSWAMARLSSLKSFLLLAYGSGRMRTENYAWVRKKT